MVGTLFGLPTLFGLSLLTIAGLIVVLYVCRNIIRYLRRNRPFTQYHIPALVLILLGMTALVGGVVGYELADREISATEYTVDARDGPPPGQEDTSDSESVTETSMPTTDDRGDTRDTETVPETRIYTTEYRPSKETEYEFERLSDEAQDIFLAALHRDGDYKTRERPSDFVYQSDHGRVVNYIQYNSTWYELEADPPGFGAGIAAMFVGGIVLVDLTLVFALLHAGQWGIESPSFKFPTAFLGGLLVGSLTLFTLYNGDRPLQEIGTLTITTAVLTGALMWIILAVVETQLSDSFNDRMTVSDPR